ncbi:YbaB/EbfC family nucleoid-associated protein [Tenacibaculum maritimum]|uniref:YbaB/EbfC family nucleoid-associated protein n=1 Tax=Tenacibaculum maritimum TaxID=107401 RepID=UPI0012E61B0D|nr:YbaB/EbfC family nucleoid-associated protein [Tenacibaculum maritimum]CAA0193292.1 nucleoid associated protein [Tenacibaculum maritimum]
MFGDISGMMSKLKETQQKVEETKQRLNNVLIDETSSDGNIKVTVTANKEIKAININDKLLSDNEELEDYLIITLNKALKKAGDINEHEMGMPNIPGMDFFK